MGLRFAAERPLGRLAKWLRILGFDTLYEQHDATCGGFETISGDRIKLTRKRQGGSGWTTNQPVYIVSDHYVDQLREVILALNINQDSIRPFTRCVRCNTRTVTASKEAVRGKIPDYIWETHHIFRTCGGCNRIYWNGSHIEHSLVKLRGLFDLTL